MIPDFLEVFGAFVLLILLGAALIGLALWLWRDFL
jgi:hypothetical protein